jgi:hypothetical protein
MIKLDLLKSTTLKLFKSYKIVGKKRDKKDKIKDKNNEREDKNYNNKLDLNKDNGN